MACDYTGKPFIIMTSRVLPWTDGEIFVSGCVYRCLPIVRRRTVEGSDDLHMLQLLLLLFPRRSAAVRWGVLPL